MVLLTSLESSVVNLSQLVFLFIEEAIEGVLRECFLIRAGFLLHVHTAVCKDIAELIFENL
jgi:hypothetical protein